jgi:hypothetical protein
MNEWALALWAMTATHHRWPMPRAKEPVAVVRQERATPTTPPSEERELLRQAIERLAPRFTGRLVWDPVARLYVPELKPEEKQ